MEITNNVYKILNYLSGKPHDSLLSNEKLMFDLQMDKEDFNDAKSKLNSEKLIDGGITHASLNTSGRSRLEKFESAEIEEIYTTVFDNYEYTLFKFFYLRKGFVALTEIPEIIKNSVPVKEGINDFPIINYLYKRTNYFLERNHQYQLNDAGKRYYLSLENKIKKEKEKESNISHYTSITAGDKSIIATGNYNNINNISWEGNIDQLSKELESIKIPDEDIAEIVEIVQIEPAEKSTGLFGNKTETWLRKMLGKCANGTWDVSVATAGGILVEILKKFYGL